MPGHLPQLDSNALARLRQLVKTLHENEGSALPAKQLVALADEVTLDAGVTVDFAATKTLGQPMVVLRMPNRPTPARLVNLSKRETEVALLVAEGLTNKQIAQRLFISTATVKDHVHNILKATGLPNRAAVAAASKIDPTNGG